MFLIFKCNLFSLDAMKFKLRNHKTHSVKEIAFTEDLGYDILAKRKQATSTGSRCHAPRPSTAATAQSLPLTA